MSLAKQLRERCTWETNNPAVNDLLAAASELEQYEAALAAMASDLHDARAELRAAADHHRAHHAVDEPYAEECRAIIQAFVTLRGRVDEFMVAAADEEYMRKYPAEWYDLKGVYDDTIEIADQAEAMLANRRTEIGLKTDQRTTGAVDHPDNASHSIRKSEGAGSVSGSTNPVHAVGTGFVTVPIKPTPEMLRAASNSVRQFSADRAATVYSAMLRAAQQTIPSQVRRSDGARDIAAERLRQMEKEGWHEGHDDDHDNASLLAAAECYVAHARFVILGQPYAPVMRSNGAPVAWPWDADSYKPKGPRRDLVRAGALIAAEIDRLDRAAKMTELYT